MADIEDSVQELSEAEILSRFMAARDEPPPTSMYYVRRPDSENPGTFKVVYSFRLTAIKNEVFTAARRRATTGSRSKGTEEVDPTRFSAAVILAATAQPWRKLMWENRDLWAKSGQTNSIDYIGDVLLPGDLDAAYKMVEELSGFGNKDGDIDDPDVSRIKN